MRRLRRLLAATVVAATAALAPPAGAAPLVGLQDDNIVNVRGAALEERLDAIAATGARVTRIDILWSEVARTRPADPRDPADPAYDWSRYDQIMRRLHARGIAVIVDFYRTPRWASPSGRPSSAPRPAEGARFAGAIARRYSGGFVAAPGEAPLPEVRRIEVWNEPNMPTFWTPQCRQARGRAVPVAPRIYAHLLALSYREIKAANPRAIVIGGVVGPAGRTPNICPRGGATATGAQDFTRLVSREGPPIDAWSLHLYPIGSPLKAFFSPSLATVPRVIPHVDRLRPGAPIYITETGYHTSYSRFHSYFVSEQQQAAWVDELVVAAGRVPRVELITWFNFQDNPLWTGGLLRGDGSRKPSYDRFVANTGTTPLPEGWLP